MLFYSYLSSLFIPFEILSPPIQTTRLQRCGPTCLRIISKQYGKLISLKEIREISETTREGSSLLKPSDAAEAMGFKSIGAKLSFEKLIQAPLPVIVHWDKQHFVVVYRFRKDIEKIFLNSFIPKK